VHEDGPVLVERQRLRTEIDVGKRRERRREFLLVAEDARVAVRNIRRDANSQLKDLVKEKEISEDEERRATGEIDDLTKKYVAEIDANLAQKEKDLMAV